MTSLMKSLPQSSWPISPVMSGTCAIRLEVLVVAGGVLVGVERVDVPRRHQVVFGIIQLVLEPLGEAVRVLNAAQHDYVLCPGAPDRVHDLLHARGLEVHTRAVPPSRQRVQAASMSLLPSGNGSL